MKMPNLKAYQENLKYLDQQIERIYLALEKLNILDENNQFQSH